MELCRNNLHNELKLMSKATTLDFRSMTSHWLWMAEILQTLSEGLKYLHGEGNYFKLITNYWNQRKLLTSRSCLGYFSTIYINLFHSILLEFRIFVLHCCIDDKFLLNCNLASCIKYYGLNKILNQYDRNN